MEKNGHMSDKELIRRLLEERDELYRQNQRLQGKVDELSDVESMKSDYEKRIAALESEQNREQQKLEEKLEKKDGKITELNTRIANLEKQVEYLKRQICTAIRRKKSKVYVTKRWHVLAVINKNLPFFLYRWL